MISKEMLIKCYDDLNDCYLKLISPKNVEKRKAIRFEVENLLKNQYSEIKNESLERLYMSNNGEQTHFKSDLFNAVNELKKWINEIESE